MGHAGGDWSEETLKEAAALWKEGKSAKQIARAIGRSRSAVLGKAFRTPSVFPPRGEKRPSETVRRVVEKLRGPHAPGIRAKAQPALRAPRLAKPLPEPTSLPKGWTESQSSRFDLDRYQRDGFEPVAFVSLGRRQCHFPLQAIEAKGGPDMPCCGAPVAGKDRYCAEHRRLMTGRV